MVIQAGWKRIKQMNLLAVIPRSYVHYCLNCLRKYRGKPTGLPNKPPIDQHLLEDIEKVYQYIKRESIIRAFLPLMRYMIF